MSSTPNIQSIPKPTEDLDMPRQPSCDAQADAMSIEQLINTDAGRDLWTAVNADRLCEIGIALANKNRDYSANPYYNAYRRLPNTGQHTLYYAWRGQQNRLWQIEEDTPKIIEARERLRKACYAAAKSRPYQLLRPVLDQIFKHDYNGDNLAESLDNPGRVAYARKPEDRFYSPARQSTTLARYLTRTTIAINHLQKELKKRRHRPPKYLLNKDGSRLISGESIIDTFAADVVAKLIDVSDKFRILFGNDIVAAYRDNVGGHSCMTEEHSDFTQIYADNPDKVSLLVFNDGRNTARTLLWTTDQGHKVMDRVYPNTGYHCSFFELWADKHGYAIRTDNGACTLSFTKGRHKLAENTQLFVTLKIPANDYCPYLDSFPQGELVGRHTLIAANYVTTSHQRRRLYLQSTCGEIETVCQSCGDNLLLRGLTDDLKCSGCNRRNSSTPSDAPTTEPDSQRISALTGVDLYAAHYPEVDWRSIGCDEDGDYLCCPVCTNGERERYYQELLSTRSPASHRTTGTNSTHLVAF